MVTYLVFIEEPDHRARWERRDTARGALLAVMGAEAVGGTAEVYEVEPVSNAWLHASVAAEEPAS